MRSPRVPTVFILSLVLCAPIGTVAQARSVPRVRSPSPAGSELVIVATDFQLEAPEQVDGGLVNVRLFNRGREMHHILVIKVDRLDRLSQIAELLRNNDWSVPWMHALGGPESVGPGGVSSTSLVLEPGRYVLACVVSSPASHRSHFMDGMIRELSVVKPPTATAAALPAADVLLTMHEWSFTLHGPLNAGRRTIRVDNAGEFEHEVLIVRLGAGRTVEQATRWAQEPRGPAPFEPVGGTTGLAPRRSVNITVDLLPGDYALLCNMYNPLSRKSHSAHGMIKAIRVVN